MNKPEFSMPYGDGNHPDEYNDLTSKEKEVLNEWIREVLEPCRIKSFSRSIPTSYGLKHRFQYSDVGFYVTNGQFKGAMLVAGFEPAYHDDLNWRFRLSKNAGDKKNPSRRSRWK